MPSDDRTTEALRIIGPAIGAFQSTIGAAAERMEAYGSAPDEAGHANTAAELGDFASDRIDVERFFALQDTPRPIDPFQRALVLRARGVLREIAALPVSSFIVEVPSGGRLAGALGSRFAELGRAFGALLVAELARTSRYEDLAHGGLLHGFPRHGWNRHERLMSPPLVVVLDGADLWGGELAQFLDGNQKIVLVVRSPSPPAPLVRLITPNTFVAQTTDIDVLASAMKTEGPAVVALMPDGAAEFIHLPGARTIHERLRVSVTPPSVRKTLQSWTQWQQQEELQQLVVLATPPSAPAHADAATNGANPPQDPAERLAAWLLSRASESPPIPMETSR